MKLFGREKGVQLETVKNVTPCMFSNKEDLAPHTFFLLNLCTPLIKVVVDYEYFLILKKIIKPP